MKNFKSRINKEWETEIYTGKNDANNTPIFEGDNVEYSYGGSCKRCWHEDKKKWVIVLRSCKFQIDRWNGGFMNDDLWMFDSENIIVISN